MAGVVNALMIELCGCEWKVKLIGIATDGAKNMTERHSGAVTRLAIGTLPGFYRIWCAANQLDLFIQEVMSCLCEDTFYGTLTSCISHLRRQQNLVSPIKTTCPKVASTRCFALAAFLIGLRSIVTLFLTILRLWRLLLRLHQCGGYCCCRCRRL
jgi:hypothetical protein